MKKAIIASAVLLSSVIFSKASAQVYVSASIGFAAPPVPIFVAAPRVVYQAPAPCYQHPVQTTYYNEPAPYYEQPVQTTYYNQPAPAPYCEQPVATTYYRRAAPVYPVEYRTYNPRPYFNKHGKHHHKW